MDITSHRNSLIHLLSQVNPFWIQFFYFLSSSITGFLLLKLLPTRDATSRSTNVDLLFVSVSADTITFTDTMEMEVFSNSQLAVLTFLMVIRGEVFISMLSVHFTKIKSQLKDSALDAASMELDTLSDQSRISNLKVSSRKHLFFVVLCYLLVGHVVGFLLILVYLRLVPEAGAVLERKGIKASMFSIFTTVSTFANCGSVPTNENMVVFRTYSGLLLILTVQVLIGNTMYASCLWAVIWLLKKLTKRREYDYLLSNYGEMECDHLLPGSHALYLALTVAGLVLVQFVLFCCMEWTSDIVSGLSTYQKVVSVVFQCVNSRYAGETIVDLAAVAPAILVLFVVMMYIPPYTCFLPRKGDKHLLKGRETSRKKQGHAFGTVGFTTGYSCKRQVKANVHCQDVSTGFSAKWSSKGKLVLIVVMLFGRFKRFSMRGGKHWKRSDIDNSKPKKYPKLKEIKSIFCQNLKLVVLPKTMKKEGKTLGLDKKEK
ncbi:hypothetical protein C4D60_Mb01t28150 [Musa balbisiana]|uniref:Uncharacterized protein n=1 Tax=Musa balbisiana TaxID=52838 RepID=A0A4S8JRA6_MUSBA|nr:hypothetical protein C4D60_Mb01t28150 [Musa balbisiana]